MEGIANEYREHSETDEPKKQVKYVQPSIAASVVGSPRYAAHDLLYPLAVCATLVDRPRLVWSCPAGRKRLTIAIPF
jgi:hypothetical protein